MIRIPPNLDGARLNVAETAELLSMEAGHFRRLVRCGFFPAAKRTARGQPYYDHELLCQLAEVIKKRVGVNGEEVMFYRRKAKTERTRPPSQSRPDQAQQASTDPYIESIMEGCRQLGVADETITTTAIIQVLSAEYGKLRPALEQAIPAVARRLLAG